MGRKAEAGPSRSVFFIIIPFTVVTCLGFHVYFPSTKGGGSRAQKTEWVAFPAPSNLRCLHDPRTLILSFLKV